MVEAIGSRGVTAPIGYTAGPQERKNEEWEKVLAKCNETRGESAPQAEMVLDCPYGSLAKNGVIEYNGVVFGCDPKSNSITLGDVSDKTKVLCISLPSGGHLKVNVDHLEDLSKAAGMFTPEDLNAILRAIDQYRHCMQKLEEISEEVYRLVEEH